MFRFAAFLLLPVAFTLFWIVIATLAIAWLGAVILDAIDSIWPEKQ